MKFVVLRAFFFENSFPVSERIKNAPNMRATISRHFLPLFPCKGKHAMDSCRRFCESSRIPEKRGVFSAPEKGKGKEGAKARQKQLDTPPSPTTENTLLEVGGAYKRGEYFSPDV